jgi:hypothetical protein
MDAISAEELGKAEWKDPAWLTWLHSDFSDFGSASYVLVTYDNNMPTHHKPLIDAYGTTLAIIDKEGHDSSGLTLEQYWREVIHRHAHRFVEQPLGSRFKYRASARRTEVEL